MTREKVLPIRCIYAHSAHTVRKNEMGGFIALYVTACLNLANPVPSTARRKKQSKFARL